MQHLEPDDKTTGWMAQTVLTVLHTERGGLTAVNLAGRSFLPLRQVTRALEALQRAGLVSRRGRRRRALERRGQEAPRGRRRERRRPAGDASGARAA